MVIWQVLRFKYFRQIIFDCKAY